MRRKALDDLFIKVYRNFESVRAITSTFRDFNIEEIESHGFKPAVAAQLYDGQVKKLNDFVAKLVEFPKVTPSELPNESVIIIIEALKKRINTLLQINSDDKAKRYSIRCAWAGCTLREANLAHAEKNSLDSINEFIKENNLVLPVGDKGTTPQLTRHLQASGFGGFIPSKINRPVLVAAQAHTTHKAIQ